jgi:hypothetical protein
MMGDKEFDPSEHLIQLKRNKKVGNAWVEVINDYLEVKWRLAWLRDKHPLAVLRTELYSVTEQQAIFKAEVTTPEGASATGWGSETVGDFTDFVEKAETKAMGRALAALGLGTQFCGDFEEGGSVTDSPIQRKAPAKPSPVPSYDGQREAAQATVGAPMSDNQRKAIRASLGDLFGKDERAEVEWMEKVQKKAVQGTAIHLTGLTTAEAAKILKAASEEKARRQSAEAQA